MTDNASKDKRLFVRLEDEDLAYVQAQGQLDGLDASTWVRMMIRKLRRGILIEATKAAQPSIAWTMENAAQPMPQPLYVEPMATHSNVPDETLNTDDLVARKMAEADAKGLTQPRNAPDDTGMDDEFEHFTGGIRPVGERRAWRTQSTKEFRSE